MSFKDTSYEKGKKTVKSATSGHSGLCHIVTPTSHRHRSPLCTMVHNAARWCTMQVRGAQLTNPHRHTYGTDSITSTHGSEMNCYSCSVSFVVNKIHSFLFYSILFYSIIHLDKYNTSFCYIKVYIDILIVA